jgi:hypothetical protein
MQSFDTKDSNTLESFDRKFESFSTKDSEVEQSDNDFVESSDRKFQSFDTFGTKDLELDQSDDRVTQSFDRKFEGSDTKYSELEKSDHEYAQSFHRKFETTDEEALSDSEFFDTFSKKEQSSTSSGCACSGSQGSTKSKIDGRCKPRSQKQIETYKRNFSARKSIELKTEELDSRLRHVQSLVLSLLRLQKRLIAS